MEELEPEEIERLNKDLNDVDDKISKYEKIKGDTTREQDDEYENLLTRKTAIRAKLVGDTAAKQAKQEIKDGAKPSNLPTQDEFDKGVKRSFFSNIFGGKKPTPKESAANLSEQPKVEGLFNRFMKKIVGEAKNGIEKTTGVKPTIAVKTALADNGTNLDNVNNDNVGPAVSTITTDPDFQAQMRKVESSLSKKIGTYFISNLPLFMILGVAIATMVLIDEGKVSPAAAAQAAAQQLSGCYMIYGDGKVYDYVKLDGCSDWYSENTNNLLKCRCNDSDSDISKTNDCTGDNSDSPYCINDDSASGKKKCINPKDKNTPPSALLKCQGEAGQSGTFVRYTSNFDDALGIISKLISLVQVTGGDTYDTENTTRNKLGLVGKILLGVIIIVTVLILGIILYNTFFQNRNMIKK